MGNDCNLECWSWESMFFFCCQKQSPQRFELTFDEIRVRVGDDSWKDRKKNEKIIVSNCEWEIRCGLQFGVCVLFTFWLTFSFTISHHQERENISSLFSNQFALNFLATVCATISKVLLAELIINTWYSGEYWHYGKLFFFAVKIFVSVKKHRISPS